MQKNLSWNKKKYCIWNQLRALEQKKNKYISEDKENNDELFILYNVICNLYIICDIKYVELFFLLIKSDNQNKIF